MGKYQIRYSFIAVALVIVTLLVVIPLTAVHMLTGAYDDQIRNDTAKTSLSKQQAVRAFLDGVYNLSYELAQSPAILSMDGELQQPVLTDAAARNDYIELFFITGTDGMQTARSEGVLSNRSDRFWFRYMMEHKRPFISQSYYSVYTGMPCVSIFIPMIKDGEMVGIFGADINLTYLQFLVSQTADSSSGQYSFIIDGDGIIIAHPEDAFLTRHINFKSLVHTIPMQDNTGSVIHNPDGTVASEERPFVISDEFRTVIDAVMDGQSGLTIVTEEGMAYYVSYKPVTLPGYSDSWSIITLQDRAAAMDVINRLVFRILLIITSIIVLFVALTVVFYKSLFNTMDSLENAKNETEKQLFRINLVTKATNIGLWYMEVNNEDPLNPDNTIAWTDGFRYFLGYKDENDFPNRVSSISKCIHPEDKDRILTILAEHLSDKTGKTPFDVEYRLIKHSGDCAYVRDTGETIRDEAGNAIYAAGAIRDITETKNLLHKLETERSMLQTMFDSIPDLIFCKDMDSKYTRCNQSLLKYFHLEMDQIIGKDDENGLRVSEEIAHMYRAMDRKVIDENKAILYESPIPAPDGTARIFETSKTPLLLNGEVTGILGIARDITERKACEDAAESANKAKSAFLSTMSHEIRTPLNAILGITEIQLHNKDLPPNMREPFDKIYASSEMLLGIINDILDLSKIEAGKMDLHVDKYEIASLISDTAQLNMMRIGSKRIDFELQVDAHMPAFLSGDELRIKQILNNLLSNAFKYTTAGTVKLTVSAESGETGDDSVILVVNVIDTGQGMTKEQVDNLFSEYARFNEKANRTTEGTGLGMTITQNLLRLMGGSITVESEPNVGSAFTVRLPQGRVNSDTLSKELVENLQQFRSSSRAQMKRVQITREPMPYGKILIVDDMETNIYVAKGLLKPYDLTIDAADSGFAAIEKIKEGKTYDIIFMDHMMPLMDGIEATKKLRKIGYTQPIVALTANAVAGHENIFLNNGFDDFISKPIDIRQMNMLLNKFIRDKQPRDVVEAVMDTEATTSGPPADVPAATLFSNKAVNGLDIKKGLEQYGGDENIYLKILRSYVSSVRNMLDIVRAFDEGDVDGYRIRVHGIKGASYDLSADPIGKMAEALERAAKDGDIPFIRENNPPFITAADHFIHDIEGVLSAIKAENPKPLTDKPDTVELAKIIAACEMYNMKRAEAAMTEIERFQYETDNDLVDWLRGNIDMMNYARIVERLSAYLADK
ncbi:MAG: ATP-binding protein [Defluviitaleaceae bacterium]|nr:ATP-binding protein [Defluviitaleaceae bacterium]